MDFKAPTFLPIDLTVLRSHEMLYSGKSLNGVVVFCLTCVLSLDPEKRVGTSEYTGVPSARPQRAGSLELALLDTTCRSECGGARAHCLPCDCPFGLSAVVTAWAPVAHRRVEMAFISAAGAPPARAVQKQPLGTPF